jgi:hypothetical protein
MAAVMSALLSLPCGDEGQALSLLGRGRLPITGFLPQATPPKGYIAIVARSATRRKLFQLVDPASPRNHVLGFEGVDQAG